MQNKIKSIMDELTADETEFLIHDIDIQIDFKTANRVKNLIYEKGGVRIKKKASPRVIYIIAAAVAVLILTMGAAYYFGVGELFKIYFEKETKVPLVQEELKILDKTGTLIDAKDSGEGFTTTVRGLINDIDYAYLLLDISKEDGSPITGQYMFTSYLRLKDEANNNPIICHVIPEPLPRTDDISNTLSYLITFQPSMLKGRMNGFPDDFDIIGKEVIFQVQDLTDFSPEKGRGELAAGNDWYMNFTFDYTGQRLEYHINKIISTDEMDLEVKHIYLSPLSLNIEVAAVMKVKAISPKLTVSIVKDDGTVMDEFLESSMGAAATDEKMEIKSHNTFTKPVDVTTIKSVMINGIEIELN